jgi:ubiquinone/menaquinone biosynthesis C-methylase UbiE
VNNLEAELLGKKWFYPFRLPGGRVTETYIPPEIAKIHTTRLEMMFAALEPIIQDHWKDTTCIDLACHQGYFAYHLAEKCKSVLGLDARAEHIESANLIRRVYGMSNLEFTQVDVTGMNVKEFEPADIVLLFGLLYHLEDPVGVLRKAAQLTQRVLLVETQTIPLDMRGTIDWGNYRDSTEVYGAFGIVADDPQNQEGGLSEIALVPGREGLIHILKRLGFSKVEQIPPPKDAYEQFPSGKRIMVACHVSP